MTKEEKFEKYKQLVHGAIHRYFGDEVTVNRRFAYYGMTYDDLAQVGYLYLWKIIDDLKDGYKPSPYIYNGVRFAVLNYLHKEGAFIRWLPLKNKYGRYWGSYNKPSPEGDTEIGDLFESEEDQFNAVDNRIFFEQICKNMKKEDKELVEYLLNDWQQNEVAEMKGLTRQAIGNRWQKIVKNMRIELGI